MSALTVAPWSAMPGLLAERPRWHEGRAELLWVDILGWQVHRRTPAPDGSLDHLVPRQHVGASPLLLMPTA